jgi:mannitol-1-/sugar-/sorbitol-6-/2-deoxyglucose-6-phosphatase
MQAVIFDMDGVLVDSEVYWLKSRQEFAIARGKLWTDDDQRLAMGRSTIEWARVMQERLNLEDPLEAIMTEMKQRVITHFEEKLPVRPGAIESVHTAATRYRVALASGSPTEIIQRVIQLTGLDKIFETVLYGDDMTHGKPDPEIYLKTAAVLNVPPRACMGVEDSGNGIRAVVAAEMVCIAAPSPAFPLNADLLALAARKIDTMEDLTLDLLMSIEKEYGNAI